MARIAAQVAIHFKRLLQELQRLFLLPETREVAAQIVIIDRLRLQGDGAVCQQIQRLLRAAKLVQAKGRMDEAKRITSRV